MSNVLNESAENYLETILIFKPETARSAFRRYCQ